ncbi:hypothetical protein SMC26_34670 [Actinomadura fulvescens]|uniref:Uncharacterized protein n=1 Tax=Actinomadura fulvescens TaxID=46160 RepID=A0ABN3QUF5_9ACTN
MQRLQRMLVGAGTVAFAAPLVAGVAATPAHADTREVKGPSFSAGGAVCRNYVRIDDSARPRKVRVTATTSCTKKMWRIAATAQGQRKGGRKLTKSSLCTNTRKCTAYLYIDNTAGYDRWTGWASTQITKTRWSGIFTSKGKQNPSAWILS